MNDRCEQSEHFIYYTHRAYYTCRAYTCRAYYTCWAYALAGSDKEWMNTRSPRNKSRISDQDHATIPHINQRDLHFRIKNSYIRHRLSEQMKWWIKNKWKLVKWRLAAIKGMYTLSGQTSTPRPYARWQLENKTPLGDLNWLKPIEEDTNQYKTYLKRYLQNVFIIYSLILNSSLDLLST